MSFASVCNGGVYKLYIGHCLSVCVVIVFGGSLYGVLWCLILKRNKKKKIDNLTKKWREFMW